MKSILIWITFSIVALFLIFSATIAYAQLGGGSLKVKDFSNVPMKRNANHTFDLEVNASGSLAGLPLNSSIVESPSHGVAMPIDNGSRAGIKYIPAENYTGPDAFSFKAIAFNTTSNKSLSALSASKVGEISVIVNPPDSTLTFVAPPEIRAGLAFVLSLLVVFLIFMIAYFVIRRVRKRKRWDLKPKFWDIIRDDNWYPSLAIFQFLLWTGIVLFAYFWISLTRLFSGVGVFIDIPYTLILVMGISAAVPAVGAAVSDFKYEGTTPVGVAPTKGVPSYQTRKKLPGFKTMLMENDKITLPRLQMFAWTWIGIIAFLGLLFLQVDRTLTYPELLFLPVLPILFVSLMGISQVTYIAAKSVKPSFVSINEVRPKKVRLGEIGKSITVLGSNFGDRKGSVWLEHYPPLNEDEKRQYCPPFKNLSDKQKRQYCPPLSKKEIGRMDDAEVARYDEECAEIYEKECEKEYMYSRSRLKEDYDVTSKATRENNRIVITLDKEIMDKLKPQKYVVRVEKDGLLTYANNDAEFETVADIDKDKAVQLTQQQEQQKQQQEQQKQQQEQQKQQQEQQKQQQEQQKQQQEQQKQQQEQQKQQGQQATGPVQQESLTQQQEQQKQQGQQATGPVQQESLTQQQEQQKQQGQQATGPVQQESLTQQQEQQKQQGQQATGPVQQESLTQQQEQQKQQGQQATGPVQQESLTQQQEQQKQQGQQVTGPVQQESLTQQQEQQKQQQEQQKQQGQKKKK